MSMFHTVPGVPRAKMERFAEGLLLCSRLLTSNSRLISEQPHFYSFRLGTTDGRYFYLPISKTISCLPGPGAPGRAAAMPTGHQA